MNCKNSMCRSVIRGDEFFFNQNFHGDFSPRDIGRLYDYVSLFRLTSRRGGRWIPRDATVHNTDSP